MKRIAILIGLLLLIGSSGNAMAGAAEGPAPNSGDGVSDGSGMDGSIQNGNPVAENSKGPAPNSGDGVSDGSGF
nr:hypothetical protein [uncultured Methanolobus sp.]